MNNTTTTISREEVISFFEKNRKDILSAVFYNEYGYRVEIYANEDGELSRGSFQNSVPMGKKFITGFECSGLNNRDTTEYEIDGKITDESFEMRYDDCRHIYEDELEGKLDIFEAEEENKKAYEKAYIDNANAQL